MADFQSGAFVFFGATGDLAHKQIFPSLQELIRDEGFNLPIVGVAKVGWNLDQLNARAKDSLEKRGVGPACPSISVQLRCCRSPRPRSSSNSSDRRWRPLGKSCPAPPCICACVSVRTSPSEWVFG